MHTQMRNAPCASDAWRMVHTCTRAGHRSQRHRVKTACAQRVAQRRSIERTSKIARTRPNAKILFRVAVFFSRLVCHALTSSKSDPSLGRKKFFGPPKKFFRAGAFSRSGPKRAVFEGVFGDADPRHRRPSVSDRVDMRRAIACRQSFSHSVMSMRCSARARGARVTIAFTRDRGSHPERATPEGWCGHARAQSCDRNDAPRTSCAIEEPCIGARVEGPRNSTERG